MFFTHVNIFTLTCDLNLQKKKRKGEGMEGREENEKGKKGGRQPRTVMHKSSADSVLNTLKSTVWAPLWQPLASAPHF